MKKIALTIMLLLWGLFTLTAQGVGNKTIRKNNINLGFGLGRGYLKDQNYSPLSYSSGGVVVNAGYRRNINDNLLFLTSDIQFGELNSAVSDYYTSDHYNVNLELGFLGNIPVNASEIKLRIGGQSHSSIDVVFYDGTEAITAFGLHSLDLTGSISWDIATKHTLSSTMSLPVFGLLIRPPWTGWDKYIVEHEDNRIPIFFRGKWTSLNDFFSINWNIQYQFTISSKWDLAAKYLFRYYRTENLKTAIIPSNQFTIGTNFNF
jgi:hypothetical protein